MTSCFANTEKVLFPCSNSTPSTRTSVVLSLDRTSFVTSALVRTVRLHRSRMGNKYAWTYSQRQDGATNNSHTFADMDLVPDAGSMVDSDLKVPVVCKFIVLLLTLM